MEVACGRIVVPHARRRAVTHSQYALPCASGDVSAPIIAQSGIKATASLSTNAQVRIRVVRPFPPNSLVLAVHRPILKVQAIACFVFFADLYVYYCKKNLAV